MAKKVRRTVKKKKVHRILSNIVKVIILIRNKYCFYINLSVSYILLITASSKQNL